LNSFRIDHVVLLAAYSSGRMRLRTNIVSCYRNRTVKILLTDLINDNFKSTIISSVDAYAARTALYHGILFDLLGCLDV